jgi:hypothetical protein
MTSLRLAGAAALCAALLLTGCAKKTDQTTTSDTTSTQAAADAGATPASDAGEATAAPDAGTTPAAEVAASAAPASSATATTGAMTATTVAGSGSNGAGSGGYIDLPVYPGANEVKEQAMTASSNSGSVAMKVYSTKDDAKKVAEWYKAHLPASFKGGILTAGDKTVGTWADEHQDGDQSVIVGSDSAGGVTRVQLTTKHGK